VVLIVLVVVIFESSCGFLCRQIARDDCCVVSASATDGLRVSGSGGVPDRPPLLAGGTTAATFNVMLSHVNVSREGREVLVSR